MVSQPHGREELINIELLHYCLICFSVNLSVVGLIVGKCHKKVFDGLFAEAILQLNSDDRIEELLITEVHCGDLAFIEWEHALSDEFEVFLLES